MFASVLWNDRNNVEAAKNPLLVRSFAVNDLYSTRLSLKVVGFVAGPVFELSETRVIEFPSPFTVHADHVPVAI
jgi:hypothetical protein